ncbi:MAG: Gfo/Idh/MocA family oxidoreductase [Planctomycetes bacterium]|nr:Gfo/Idh/MocA family oxidoreductase [Planctomycetota bacterium]
MGISVGLVGLGSFGSAFAELYKSHPDVDRIALCDREIDRVKKFADDPFMQEKCSEKDCYDSLDAICDSDVDALVIITQPWLHAPQAIQAMRAGKHVYSAVPLICIPDDDECLDWCDQIVSTSLQTGMNYMLGETSYYRSDAMFARRKAAEGAFGNFVYAEGEYMHDVDSWCNLRQVSKDRANSQAGAEWEVLKQEYIKRGILGGPMHYPTHSVCGPVCVMNAHAEKVTAYGYRNQSNDPFFADSAFSNEVALFKMSNGATVRIAEMREAAGQLGEESETFRIVGTEGSYSERQWHSIKRSEPLGLEKPECQKYEWEDMRDPLPEAVEDGFKTAMHKEAENPQDLDFVPGGHGGSHPYLVHEFVDSIVNERLPAINAWEAARYMAMGVMAHKSALRDGETLDVPDWGDAPGTVQTTAKKNSVS